MSDHLFAGPCGLYCGICPDNIDAHECHGCGCTCHACGGLWHHQHCEIAQCVEGHGYRTCADCAEMPCTRLTQFAYDPIWRTHLPVIENLRRIRRLGVAGWLDEQAAYWADEGNRRRWLALYRQCGEAYQASKADV